MTAHQEEVGFEIEQVIPEVTAASGIISPRVASNASRTALRYFTHAERYHFVRDVSEFGSGVILTVGIFSPLEYNPENTIIGNDVERRRGGSFHAAVRALVRFSGSFIDEVNYAYIMIVPDGVTTGFHRDKYEGARATIQLAGHREVNFVHTGMVQSTTELTLLPTDAYRMTFTNDENSLSHAVDYTGAASQNLGLDNLNIGIYINH
jgi:hypothetical protein